MAIAGAFVRVEVGETEQVERRLNALESVSTFDLPEEGKVGLLIEAENLDAVHKIITKQVPATRGVLGAWPVYVNTEDEEDIEVGAG